MTPPVDPGTPEAALHRLTGLYPKLIDLSLDRVRRLLADLGDPQEAVPPVIHVAGTNGKGSVVATLRALLEAHGLRTHVYTSPHLVRFNERIRLAGSIIEDAPLVALLEEVERVNAGRPITLFEATTAAAFLAFARTPADALVLETGLGGRLDATNVITRPRVTVLTPISMDHEHFLGGTLAAIAGEKAQIQKAGVPSVVSRQPAAALAVITARAAEIGAPLLVEGEAWRARRTARGLLFQGAERTWRLPAPRLPGVHQIHNAGAALAAAERFLGDSARLEALAAGLQSVDWPARLQRLTHGPLVDQCPAEWELWLDGGHNPSAGRALATFLPGWRDRPIDAICGMMANKDAAGYLGPMSRFLARFRAVPVQGETPCHDPDHLAATAQAAGLADAQAQTSVGAALADLIAVGDGGPRRVLICGSLYLAGEVLRDNG